MQQPCHMIGRTAWRGHGTLGRPGTGSKVYPGRHRTCAVPIPDSNDRRVPARAKAAGIATLIEAAYTGAVMTPNIFPIRVIFSLRFSGRLGATQAGMPVRDRARRGDDTKCDIRGRERERLA
jgi:hypothetical protein